MEAGKDVRGLDLRRERSGGMRAGRKWPLYGNTNVILANQKPGDILFEKNSLVETRN